MIRSLEASSSGPNQREHNLIGGNIVQFREPGGRGWSCLREQHITFRVAERTDTSGLGEESFTAAIDTDNTETFLSVIFQPLASG